MKYVRSFLRAAVGLVMLAAFVLGLVAWFRAVSGGRTPAQPGSPPPGETLPVPARFTPPGYPPPLGYPPPQPTLSAPEMATMMAEATASEATASAEETAVVSTVIAQMTAAVLPTFTPLPDGRTCYIDSTNGFSLLLPLGWYSDPPPRPNATAGMTILYNFAGNDEGYWPPGSLKIQITSSQLDEEQSFAQWLSNFITYNTSSTLEEPPLTATVPMPYTLGPYAGVSFVFTSQAFSFSWREILLTLSDGRVLIIALMPADSSALSDGLSLLSTLDASGAASCASPSGGS